MPKNQKKSRPAERRGSAPAVETVVGDKRRHAAVVAIQNHGRDERGAVLGVNGMRWLMT